ncbi:MAG: alpha/beta hydrolase [Verrucomicrobia bacterium]|nr:alpha/beta hydrolase [Verrucomicrobiota bacterium]
MKTVLLLLTLLTGALAALAQTAPKATTNANVIVKRDVVYGRVLGAGLLADLAHPDDAGPFPAIVSVHGGRWVAGSKTETGVINIEQWAGFGFFAMSIDYRLIGGTPAPACYQDLLCAIRWVHAHADEYHIDPKRIFLIGQSAGGHLVSLAATLGEGPWPRTGGWTNQPCDFRGAISVSGAYDVRRLDWGNGWTPPGEEFIAARDLASPINHINGSTKPLLILHSDNDRSIPIVQAVNMSAALDKAGARHRFVHYTDKGHLVVTPDVIKESLAFIEEVAGPVGKTPR